MDDVLIEDDSLDNLAVLDHSSGNLLDTTVSLDVDLVDSSLKS